mmetsp:Transcript_16999/g.25159  ORF Transcript_16999/g.25159 Transcript_16999/m.25159 type:complete len:89 (+) Transcript_16999:221-487(+)
MPGFESIKLNNCKKELEEAKEALDALEESAKRKIEALKTENNLLSVQLDNATNKATATESECGDLKKDNHQQNVEMQEELNKLKADLE